MSILGPQYVDRVIGLPPGKPLDAWRDERGILHVSHQSHSDDDWPVVDRRR